MEISGIHGMAATGALAAASSPSVALAGPPPAPPDGSATISRYGVLMSRLQQLAQQDPSKFKAIASQGAQDLQVAAQKATAEQAQGLADLSNGFAQAAKAGNPSVLQPKAVIRTLGRGQHRVHTISGQAQAVLTNVSEKVDEALGLNPPPLGPWFPR